MAYDCGGDPSEGAVHAVMVEIQRDLLSFLARRLGNRDEAVDVLHDAYVKVLDKIGGVRETEKLRAWIYRVVKTTLIDHFRARVRRGQAETEYQLLEALHLSGAGEDELDLVVCSCLYKLLPTLKPEYASVLWRADLIGEPRESTAAALGISESNLRVRLHRARGALRRRLEETCRTCPIHGYFDCDCGPATKLRSEIGPDSKAL